MIGQWIFKVLGITLPAFQMAGSVVLFLIALDMLRARRSPVQETCEEADEGLANRESRSRRWVLLVRIVAVCAASYVILRLSAHGAQWVSPLAMRVTTRLMGLLVTAIAFQFFISALQALKVIPA